jgi:hypothetical protein
MRTNTTIVVILLTLWALVVARADDYGQDDSEPNYIIERQQAYLVEGTPDERIIDGDREIDGYRQPDGSIIWFERFNIVKETPPDEN